MYGEAAFLAYYFHWSRSEVMGMSRRERQMWLGELRKINARINEDTNRVVSSLTRQEWEERVKPERLSIFSEDF